KVTIMLVTHDLREAAFLADRIFCMSSRPGRIIAERNVKLPRPRDLDITYTGEFTDLVHDLRLQIASARQAPCARADSASRLGRHLTRSPSPSSYCGKAQPASSRYRPISCPRPAQSRRPRSSIGGSCWFTRSTHCG